MAPPKANLLHGFKHAAFILVLWRRMLEFSIIIPASGSARGLIPRMPEAPILQSPADGLLRLEKLRGARYAASPVISHLHTKVRPPTNTHVAGQLLARRQAKHNPNDMCMS